MPLSYKHQAFIDSFLIHNRNATEAYCDVYGVSREVGGVQGHYLLKKTNIISEIKRRIDESNMTPLEFDNKSKYIKSTNVYLFREDFMGLVKIGVAVEPVSRLSVLQVSCPQKVTLLGCVEVENATEYEAELHARYSDKHFRGEWFRLTDSDIEEIKLEWENLR